MTAYTQEDAKKAARRAYEEAVLYRQVMERAGVPVTPLWQGKGRLDSRPTPPAAVGEGGRDGEGK